MPFAGRIRCATSRSESDNSRAARAGAAWSKWWKSSGPTLLGWKAYFGLAQTPQVWRKLDKWVRHRLRAIQLKHWKQPRTIYRELKALGADDDVAKRVALYSRRWWRNSAMLLNSVLTVAYFDRMGVPRLS
jgi:RNA-directed DNA polymerase